MATENDTQTFRKLRGQYDSRLIAAALEYAAARYTGAEGLNAAWVELLDAAAEFGAEDARNALLPAESDDGEWTPVNE
ncbi:MAG: hypothetical protein ABI445_24170 [Polyangia bacterium]